MSEESSNNNSIAIWVGGTICAAMGLAVILYFLRYVLESVFYFYFCLFIVIIKIHCHKHTKLYIVT